MLSISSISFFVFLCASLNTVRGITCDDSEVDCSFPSENVLRCMITTGDPAKAHDLIYNCSRYYKELYPNLDCNEFQIQGLDHQTIVVEIAPGIAYLDIDPLDANIELIFKTDHPDVEALLVTSGDILNVSKDFLIGFSNLRAIYLYDLTLDGFPVFYSSQLGYIQLVSLILPSVATVTSAMLNQPELYFLNIVQSSDAIWFDLADNAFDNARNITDMRVFPIQRYPSPLFANSARINTIVLLVDSVDIVIEEDAFIGLNGVETLIISHSINMNFLLNYTFPKLECLFALSCNLITLDQEFFARQKSLIDVYLTSNPINCNCDLAWLSHVSHNLGWRIEGLCSTPVLLNGNSITDSSNYINCPVQSFHCFNDTFICPSDSVCVNTPTSAYCDCTEAGYEFESETNTCVDIDECSLNSSNCSQICTNTVGSYNCSCNPGYTLDSDMYTCSGVNKLVPQGIFLVLIVLMLLL
ncbi:hypothetical protein LOD99_3618 [Oopsacas minuta]|uniref:EGF-like domain-containing protein n=1 Tax=Oopsacas minuta TaxID=111878 RepID=A0AAV7JWX7_9METZ|nr:hypothetical protein LOD99_3618 [Oopsacas minuta]